MTPVMHEQLYDYRSDKTLQVDFHLKKCAPQA